MLKEKDFLIEQQQQQITIYPLESFHTGKAGKSNSAICYTKVFIRPSLKDF